MKQFITDLTHDIKWLYLVFITAGCIASHTIVAIVASEKGLGILDIPFRFLFLASMLLLAQIVKFKWRWFVTGFISSHIAALFGCSAALVTYPAGKFLVLMGGGIITVLMILALSFSIYVGDRFILRPSVTKLPAQ